jgi:hypothetical protein
MQTVVARTKGCADCDGGAFQHSPHVILSRKDSGIEARMTGIGHACRGPGRIQMRAR